MTDARRHAPAAQRNRGPILDVLRRILPETGTVLEIGSGTGEHAVHFAAALPRLLWQPSDPSPEARASIGAWRAAAGLANLLEPLDLDLLRPWPLQRANAVVAINVIHVAPWTATLALLDGAAAVLAAGTPLVLYGPFRRGGVHTAESNALFDASLRASDPAWGVRDLDAVVASASGFTAPEIVAMPANNLTVVFRRAGRTG